MITITIQEFAEVVKVLQIISNVGEIFKNLDLKLEWMEFNISSLQYMKIMTQ